jgi:acetyl-CoA acetyltransferase
VRCAQPSGTSTAIDGAVRRAGIAKEKVDEVIMGIVLPLGYGQNPARQAAIKAKLPWEAQCFTINKVCGSGLKAVMLAAQAVQLGDADVVVAGGMESMSQAPYYLERARFGYRMAREKAEALGCKIMATIGAQASAGLDMKYVLVAPILAVPKCLAKEGISQDKVDLFEINEAFSGSTVAVLRELKLDPAKVNVNGGSVALGHPIGASGCRVLVTLLHEMMRSNKKVGLASLCLGGGEAVAMVVKR